MKRLAMLLAIVAALGACGSKTNTASRDRLRVPPSADTTTTGSGLGECKRSQYAAAAGSAVFYANSPLSTWLDTFQDMTAMNPPALELPDGVRATATTMIGGGWTLTMAGGGNVRPGFTCSVDPNG